MPMTHAVLRPEAQTFILKYQSNVTCGLTLVRSDEVKRR